MTTISHSNWYLNSYAFPIIPGDISAATVDEATPTHWVLSDGTSPTFTFAFEGTFTGYDAGGIPTGGVITGYTITLFTPGDPPRSLTVSDFSMPVADYLAFFAAKDTEGALAVVWAGNQTLVGEVGNFNHLWGWGGDDILTGGDGADNLQGGEGYDQVSGGAGDDLIFLANHREARVESVYGGDGKDTLEINAGGVEDAFINLEVGFVRMDGVLSAKIFSFEDVSGGDGNDRIVGTSGNNLLRGEAGDDTITAGAGDDTGVGSAGNDYIRGGDGNDRLTGAIGNDLLIGEAGDDRLEGGDGRDRLYGEIGADTLIGGDGTDLLDGGDGADILQGGDWGDTLLGGAGDDQLTGGRNDDILTGGLGADRYYFNEGADLGRDVITDFEDGIDRIHINRSDVTSFSQVTVTTVGSDAVVTFPSGSSIVLTGAAGTITDADFVFGGG